MQLIQILPAILVFILILFQQNINANIEINDSDNLINNNITFNNFNDYKIHLNKTYLRPYQEQRSRLEYANNIRHINEQNKNYKDGKSLFMERSNIMSDLSSKQYLRQFVRLQRSHRRKLRNKRNSIFSQISHDDPSLPISLDWRELGFKTPASNQKSCGSCYAFSIAHTIEGQIFKRTGKIFELSVQQLVDCSVKIGNHGCSGGSLRNTLRYLEQSGGLMRDEDYPYVASMNKCKYNIDLSIVNVSNWAILPARDENSMKVAIATIGPIAVSINAAKKSFQLYSHGVYDDPTCSSASVNHAMLAIGYTPDYWILKNWWGTRWGDGGYMKIKRGTNLCGISNYAAYAVV